jgi:hypothetical protein
VNPTRLLIAVVLLALACGTHRGAVVSVEPSASARVGVERGPGMLGEKHIAETRSVTGRICAGHGLHEVEVADVSARYAGSERLFAFYSRPGARGARPEARQGLSVSLQTSQDGSRLSIVVSDWERVGESEELREVAEQIRRALTELYSEPDYRVTLEYRDLGFWRP